MKKENILKKNWEFQSVLNKKKQYVSRSLILYYRKSNNFRIGISIPKKFANAVKRNKYRRQVREIMKDINYQSLNYDVVLIIRKDFINRDFETKSKEVKKIFGRFK